ncbi:molybdate ABC transporter substrate-binding protein [Henriciella litoralis]|uniref:molybdate ABC transporter substrate-binding protein n=1 Tax=Henriciella litoralis TaxID=568102 RepID=UPI000A064D8E|nr:molybdate ABC transporter substrate-binding protein [Henriciella litoralis]
MPLRQGPRFAMIALWAAIACISACSRGAEQPVMVATASNFLSVAEALERDFEGQSDVAVNLVSGSTGQLYTQITHGAPYDIFLAADQRRPEMLEEAGYAQEGSRFTYAIGRLALWSRDEVGGPDGVDARLRNGDFRALAIANPDLAPYGAAAIEVLEALGLQEALQGQLVRGQNVGQVYALVATGNAEMGFVALSQMMAQGDDLQGDFWEVPSMLYAPIRQDGVLLTGSADNPAAAAFLAYLGSERARRIIARSGYGVEE